MATKYSLDELVELREIDASVKMGDFSHLSDAQLDKLLQHYRDLEAHLAALPKFYCALQEAIRWVDKLSQLKRGRAFWVGRES